MWKRLLLKDAVSQTLLSKTKRLLGQWGLLTVCNNVCSTHGSCLHTQVTNTNKDTSLKWFKEDRPVTQAVYDQSSGDSSLTIPQVVTASALRSDWEVMNKHYPFRISCGFMKRCFPPQVTKKDAGSYRAAVSDKRGEDVSTLQLLGDGESWNSICSGADLSEADVFASSLTYKQTWVCCHLPLVLSMSLLKATSELPENGTVLSCFQSMTSFSSTSVNNVVSYSQMEALLCKVTCLKHTGDTLLSLQPCQLVHWRLRALLKASDSSAHSYTI